MALALPALLHAQAPDTTKHTSHVARGAKIGAIAGTIGLGLFGLGMSGMCERDCGSAATNGLLVGAGAGAVLGVAAGAVIGSLFENWDDGPHKAFPVRANVALGIGTMQAGVQYVRGDTRIGVEGAKLALDDSFTPAYSGDPADPHMRTTTAIRRDGGQLGIVMERKLIGPLWATGSVMRRWSTEMTTTMDWRNITGPDFSHPVITRTTRNDAGLGGSLGLVARHRVVGGLYFVVDARQHYRPNAVRTLTAGVEF